MHYTPSTPADTLLYSTIRGLDLAGLRRMWAAIVPEYKALGLANPRRAVEHRASPRDMVFELGWAVVTELSRRHSHKTGRRVSYPVYHSGFATEYRQGAEWETDPTEIHAAFLRVLARYQGRAV